VLSIEIGFRSSWKIGFFIEWEIKNAHIARHSYNKISRNKVELPEGSSC
jgi:hypothetical protein